MTVYVSSNICRCLRVRSPSILSSTITTDNSYLLVLPMDVYVSMVSVSLGYVISMVNWSFLHLCVSANTVLVFHSVASQLASLGATKSVPGQPLTWTPAYQKCTYVHPRPIYCISRQLLLHSRLVPSPCCRPVCLYVDMSSYSCIAQWWGMARLSWPVVFVCRHEQLQLHCTVGRLKLWGLYGLLQRWWNFMLQYQ